MGINPNRLGGDQFDPLRTFFSIIKKPLGKSFSHSTTFFQTLKHGFWPVLGVLGGREVFFQNFQSQNWISKMAKKWHFSKMIINNEKTVRDTIPNVYIS